MVKTAEGAAEGGLSDGQRRHVVGGHVYIILRLGGEGDSCR